MRRLFIDLKDLGSVRRIFRGTFDRGTIDLAADDIRQLQPLEWSAFAERAGVEIRVGGSITTSVELLCSRCLEKVQYPIAKEFELFFRKRDTLLYDEDEEIELAERDTKTGFFMGTELAIGDILHEQILLALPMKALCNPACKGLCPTCGSNLNVTTCNCPTEKINPAIEAFLQVKQRLEERSS